MTHDDPRLLTFYLNALHDLGEALAGEKGRIDALPTLRDYLYRILGTAAVGRGVLLQHDEEAQRLTPAAAKGMRPGRQYTIPILPPRAKELAGQLRVFHLQAAPGRVGAFAEALRGAVGRGDLQWVVPLATGTSFIGVILLGPKINGAPLENTELGVLREMAGMLAMRLDEARTRRQMLAQMRQLQRLNRDLRGIYLDTLRAMTGIIDDPEPDGGPTHSVRVASLAAEIGRRLKLSPSDCDRLYLAGLLHDIGKQVISREVLGKRGTLNAKDRRQIEAHPMLGFELINHLRFPWGDVAEIIRHHHERLDGAGYPDRLRGDQISIDAKILMMAEAFDSMTSRQPWRPALSAPKVVEQISRNLGLQFEPAVVQALCEAVEAGLSGETREREFITHLEAGFDSDTIRRLLGELRQQLHAPSMRPAAQIVEIEGDDET